jgi:hypothetical protein
LSIIANHGNPDSPIWIIVEDPYTSDIDKGYIWSGGHGYTHRKVWSMSGLCEPYIYVLKPCIGATYDFDTKFSELISQLCDHAVPFVLPVSVELFTKFCQQQVTKSQGKALFKKYAGNLLTSQFLNYPHYVIPQYDPAFVGANYDYHEIQAYIDYGHVREEWEYYVTHDKQLNPLLKRTLVTEPTYDDLLSFLYRARFEFTNGKLPFISVDIETIRPKKHTPLHTAGHPGYPYTISLAMSPTYGISFSFWDYNDSQLVVIWRELDYLFREVPLIGQNFSVFDSHFLEALGFQPDLRKFQDTLIRHHILWPSLEHKLQFQTKQYTREPFYKDEGKNWNPSQKKDLMRYNALDATVTYEIFLAQEAEFIAKPHLKG